MLIRDSTENQNILFCYSLYIIPYLLFNFETEMFLQS